MRHRSPLHPLENVADHPLLALSLVSKYYHALIESETQHELRRLQDRIGRMYEAEDAEDAEDSKDTEDPEYVKDAEDSEDAETGEGSKDQDNVTATNHRSVYIHFARNHCHTCGSNESVSDSVLLGDDTPVCFMCDWHNWKANISLDGEALICVLDDVALLVARDVGIEYKLLDEMRDRDYEEVTSYNQLNEAVFEWLKNKVLLELDRAPEMHRGIDRCWAGVPGSGPSTIWWTWMIEYVVTECEVLGITENWFFWSHGETFFDL